MSRRDVRRFESRIDDIVQSAKKLAVYSKSFRKMSDLEGAESMVLDAIVRRLQVIGEAAYKISTEHPSRADPNIDWETVSRFRQLVVHDYWKIDSNELWDSIKNFVPHLIKQLKNR